MKTIPFPRFRRLRHLPPALLLAACGSPAPEDLAPWPGAEPESPAPPLIASHAVAHHTCALDEAGTVTCWGLNDRGQLGSGNASAASIRVEASRPFGMVAVGGHTCALDRDGTAWCWGPNEHGQLGDGSTADRFASTRVATERRFTRIAVGAAHTCALDEVGRAFCWGDNRWGQIGDGTRTASRTPVAVATDAVFSTLGAGSRHTCGVTGDARLLCWGDNFLGQIARPRTEPGALAPVPVGGLPSDVDAVSAGHGHTCAVAVDGTGWCWGQNGIGQLGSGAPPGASGPVRVAGIPPLASIRAGYHHTCAIDTSGAGWCWGANTASEPGDASVSGQLGSDISWTNLPLALTLEPTLLAIAPGVGHTCALTRAGVIYCFGSNRFHQLGRVDLSRSLEPIRVSSVGPAD